MSVEIKICGLRTSESIDAACDAGAGMVGLVFFPKSPRNVTPAEARELAARARGRASVVALVVDASDAEIAAIVEAARPDLLQLHGRETPERCRGLKASFGVPVMKAIGVSSAADLIARTAYRGAADRILLDAKPPPASGLPGGNGAAFDWSLIAGLGKTEPFMLSGGLTPQNVAEAIRISAAPAVDVSSGVEIAPGKKSTELIYAFVAAVRAASP